MTAVVPLAATAGLLFAIGLYGMIGRTGLIHRLLGANIMASAIFLFLVVLSTRGIEASADPVPQAMVLTGIVISVCITAFALGLIRYLRVMTGEDELRRSTRDADGQSADD
ncbi:MAG: cation:proton antiporter subunit C [Wenzhouxiangellaceae bacterium]